MRALRIPGIALFLCAYLAACAAASSGGMKDPSKNRGVLTAAEISMSGAATAHDAIAQLRPEYLRARGIATLSARDPQGPVVYVDNTQHGAIETLRSISAQSVALIEYLSAGDATTRFGTDHTGGAILVFTKR